MAIPAEIDRCVPCVGCERSRSVAASLLSCGQIRPEMIKPDANVIGTVERSQDELIKERHASHAHTDTRTTAPHARSQRSGGRRVRSRGRRAAAEAAMGTKKKKKHSRGSARNGLRLSTV